MTDEQFLESLGKKIAALREKKGISQNEFAKRLDTWNNQIRRIEKGLVGANIITIRKIAKELDVPLSTLVNIK